MQSSCEDVVGAPPEAEEGAEEESCTETVVKTTDAMIFELEHVSNEPGQRRKERLQFSWNNQ